MPANEQPKYTKNAEFSAIALTAANTSSQGGGTIGTDIFLLVTMGADGTFIRNVEFILGESTISTASTACVGRLFLSTQSSGATTSANTHLLREIALASQTPSNTLPAMPVIVPLNIWVPTGFSLLASVSVAPAANTHWKAVLMGAGDY